VFDPAIVDKLAGSMRPLASLRTLLAETSARTTARSAQK
jgi:hypothetical protein